MKAILKLLVPVFLLTLTGVASAAGSAIGTDMIRMLDKSQAVGSSFNIIYQRPLTAGNAAVFNLAIADNNDMMLEGSFKSYTGAYMAGIYYQAGVALIDAGNNTDLGFSGAIGYESSPATGFLFFGTVKGMVVPGNNPGNGFQYTPMLGAMFVF